MLLSSLAFRTGAKQHWSRVFYSGRGISEPLFLRHSFHALLQDAVASHSAAASRSIEDVTLQAEAGRQAQDIMAHG